jgi:hypothetical protein
VKNRSVCKSWLVASQFAKDFHACTRMVFYETGDQAGNHSGSYKEWQ